MEQKHCRICGNTNLIELMNLGTHTLSGRFPLSPEEKIPSYPLVLVQCAGENTCGLVQLKYNANRDDLYRHFYGYMSGVNSTMKKHLENLVREIEGKIVLEPGDTVLDIGSNDGTTLKFYKSYLNRIGVDPTGEQFRHLYTGGITLVPEYFDSEFVKTYIKDKVKVVTSIAMFYDLPDPVEFARNIKNILHRDGIWVTEQSYLPRMLSTNSFDTICHEHLEYYSFRQIQYIADKVGLEILNLSFNDINGGSFRITFGHRSQLDFGFPRIFPDGVSSTSGLDYQDNDIISRTILNEANLKLNTTLPFENFVRTCAELKDNLVSFLRKEKELGKKICIYGASTKGNVLLQYYKIDSTLIECVAERNPDKYGRLTPNTLIPIVSEEEVRNMKPDYMLVLPWHFKEEFLTREKEYMDNGGKLIFPLPTIQIFPPQKKDV